MKNSIAFKVFALLLATVFLLVALGSALGVAVLVGAELYTNTFEEEYEIQMWSERRNLAVGLVYSYATLELGGIPEEYFAQYYGYDWKTACFREGFYHYAIFDGSGAMVESTVEAVPEDAAFYEIELVDVYYRRLVTDPAQVPEGVEIITDDYYDAANERYVRVQYVTELLDDYTVQLYILEGAYSYDAPWLLLQGLYPMRYHLFWVFGGSLLVFIILAVLLCCCAGRKPGRDGVRPGGLNRLPLDLYTAGAGCALLLLLQVSGYLVNALLYEMPQLMLYLLVLVGALGSLTVVCLLFAWASQLKAPDRYWLKNTLIGRVLWWIGKGIYWIFRALHSLLRLLPVAWQWVLTAAAMGFVPMVLFLLYLGNMDYNTVAEVLFLLLFLVSLAADVAVVLYGAYCFGTLMKGVRRMSRGDLGAKIPLKRLLSCFRDFALHLNTLSDTISVAAERQMRSERMKTELITNVSHDIKTPLTSIINFVDLLQKPHTTTQEQEYLEVLSRQSAQMKKLIEDLMELSKANSGSITVNPQRVDAAEAVNQALGEFADKLEAARLTPVFHRPQGPIYMYADGRHVWRVLANLLSNAVKYALPGTRLYIDLMEAEHSVVLSLKNVSRAELNISADELMERFVQGDASRKSEGSGLGLNIAKSLMEVQKGQLQLLLDGDLFKVTLTFPGDHS